MARKRTAHSAAFKAKVALTALRGDKTLAQIAGQFSIHPQQVTTWRQRLLDGAPDLFEDRRRKAAAGATSCETELYEQIGRLKMELEWVKKKSTELGG